MVTMRETQSRLEAPDTQAERGPEAHVEGGRVPQYSFRGRKPQLVVVIVCLVTVALVTAFAMLHNSSRRNVVSTGRTSDAPAAAGSTVAHTATTGAASTLFTAPTRTDTPAPEDPTLDAYLLKASEWPDAVATTLASAESHAFGGQDPITGEFSPCGYRFDDTSLASGRATTTLANLDQTDLRASGISYVYEDIAAFGTAQAQDQVTMFDREALSCQSSPSIGGLRFYDDIPVIDGEATSWEVSPVALPASGDGAAAVELSKSDRSYILVVLRKAGYVAFLRVLTNETASTAALTNSVNGIIASAASRIP
jgi:hypothetical protein